MKKILYGVQATGNGHVMRLTELLPFLQDYGEVTVLSSGLSSTINTGIEVIKKNGLYFTYKKGGLDYLTTLKKAKIVRLIKDINNLNVEDYDYVISDFEPITSWACKTRGVPYISMGHQVSFASDKTPRPEKKDFIAEAIVLNYAPFSNKKIGFHFDCYDDFIYYPPIRRDIKTANIENLGHYTVYLAAYKAKEVISVLSRFKYKFHVFTCEAKREYKEDNINVYPLSKDMFLNSFIKSSGIICGAGFETPSEAMYMGKKLLAIPIKGQYEQACNGAALKKIGVITNDDFNSDVVSDWLMTNAVTNKFNCDVNKILKEILT